MQLNSNESTVVRALNAKEVYNEGHNLVFRGPEPKWIVQRSTE